MTSDRLVLASARVALGLLYREDLADVAASALADGCDSPSLRMLAGLTPSEADGARPLFERALCELGISVPDKRKAIMRLAREMARDIVSGTTRAYDGAMAIWDLALRAPTENLPELDAFVYAASEWEDRPEHRAVFEEGIKAAARELLRA